MSTDKPLAILWESLQHHRYLAEDVCVQQIRKILPVLPMEDIQQRAATFVEQSRASPFGGHISSFLAEYDLSSAEGISLMCLAESLLRIPDSYNIDALISDKVSTLDWSSHLGRHNPLFVNAATWGLILTGKIMDDTQLTTQSLTQHLQKFLTKATGGVVRQALKQMMKIMSEHFILGFTIENALTKAQAAQQFRYSFDMLGEAARTLADAEEYFQAYLAAIELIGHEQHTTDPLVSNGVSVKLSALHPTYYENKWPLCAQPLLEKMRVLVDRARHWNIALTIDAEESDRLLLSLRVVEALVRDKDLLGSWSGLGLAVQAYSKRALATIEYIATLAQETKQKIHMRLVKGAYWDYEIKVSQEQGHHDYPVFTRKEHTDLSYLACVQRMLEHRDVLHLQFATHNALTVACILHMCQGVDFEFQCLHGMGSEMAHQIIGSEINKPCRIYAPVGAYQHLLPYLVRRLLENGANTSFLNQMNKGVSMAELLQDPIQATEARLETLLLPRDLYSDRPNSQGLDITHQPDIARVLERVMSKNPKPAPLVSMTGEQVSLALQRADAAVSSWQQCELTQRVACLQQAARILESERTAFIALLVEEAGKTLVDAINEVREAIDFCYYYARRALVSLQPQVLEGPTGESNTLFLQGRGVMLCISPWNFPLAIFLGQVTAALVAGNTVLAKPASQTTVIAAKAVAVLHQAGIPKHAVQILPASGALVADILVPDNRIAGILFTGSTETAWTINQILARRRGPIVPFIAETGGINAMIVDSSALLEQVVQDVINSAFLSAGQRCSALRVLYIQDDIYEPLMTMLTGAMAVLTVGDPAELTTDVGPVIDRQAQQALQEYIHKLQAQGRLVYQTPLTKEAQQGCFVAPTLLKTDINSVREEIFGPVLHVVSYHMSELDTVVQAINKTGYGLTVGLHSRIQNRLNTLQELIKAGNCYINRNMIGAVVGVQPFGGERLSGTGPKAGGPHYLYRLVTEKTVSINETAVGGNVALLAGV